MFNSYVKLPEGYVGWFSHEAFTFEAICWSYECWIRKWFVVDSSDPRSSQFIYPTEAFKSKKTSWVKWPFGNEFNGKNISKKFRIPMDFQKNNEFLWKNPMSFGKKQWIPMNGKIHGLSIAVCIFRLPGPNEISWFKAWLIVGVARGDISN